ncbi:hypothetical protein, partial [Nitrosovibrio sp. Nv6]|uniref:hypothetical protein n=1 Tax=Nitrosovibrio sp. Nv6 TaxID=1855340 RepID=UPI001C431DF8
PLPGLQKHRAACPRHDTGPPPSQTERWIGVFYRYLSEIKRPHFFRLSQEMDKAACKQGLPD